MLIVSEEVADALAQPGKAVVALESTILCHGMPYPKNVKTAREVEQIVRNAGAVPATIAIIDGQLKVGLDSEEIEMLGRRGMDVRKVSRRDVAYVVSQKQHGATTVSATMLIAAMAGIQVFVTGGIGGVHRGGELTLDVSTDLRELGKTPVAVVCAGVKSILDIPKTLEYLETEGVPVMAFGQDAFPSFFTANSGVKAPIRVDNPGQAAGVIHTQLALKLGGALVAAPIPVAYQADAKDIERAIKRAVKETQTKGITGNAITPYILDRVQNLTRGRSLETNIELIKNNARVGSQIAIMLARMPRPRL